MTRRVHFIGIGGVGMNGLAQLAAQSDWQVSGSDRAQDPTDQPFKSLLAMGIVLYPQDGSGLSEAVDQVVYSTAIEEDNPDLVAATAHSIPLLHRSEFLKQLVGDHDLIAVAGTAGKTTTTAMLGWIFEQLGHDPSVYNGAAVLNWKTSECLGNIRKGNANLWIIEADESDKSFLNFSPTHSIITNISRDHYELDELNNMFDQFEQQTSGGTIRGQELEPRPINVPMLGDHNRENARCVLALCEAIGLDSDAALAALAEFKGVERRLEITGRIAGITVIDDYAHNPAKIKAALAAVTQVYGTTHAFWRPHGFGPLRQGFDAFVDVFAKHWNAHGGSLHILPVYYAGGTTTRDVSSDDLVAKLNSSGVPAKCATNYNELKNELEQVATSGDAILGMGARDPELPRFAKRLVEEWKTN